MADQVELKEIRVSGGHGYYGQQQQQQQQSPHLHHHHSHPHIHQLQQQHLPQQHHSQPQHPSHGHFRGHSGQTDFVGFDNEAIDFRHLEDYINGDDDNNIYFHESLVGNEVKNPEAANSAGLKNVTAQHLLPAQPPSSGNNGAGTPLPPHFYGVVNAAAYKNGGLAYSHPHHLPDSPPDSGSEPPYSPPDEEQKHLHNNLGVTSLQDMLLPPLPGNRKHHQQQLSYSNTQPLKHMPDLQLQQQQQASVPALLSPMGLLAANGTMSQHGQGSQAAGIQPNPMGHSPTLQVDLTGNGLPTVFGSISGRTPNHPNSKKRKLCESPCGGVTTTSGTTQEALNGIVHIKQEPGSGGAVVIPPPPPLQRHCASPDQGSNLSVSGQQLTDDDLAFDFNSDSGMAFGDSAFQCIRFQPFQPSAWHVICDASLKEIPPSYRVDADKGFNFSNADDAFVCQKKNHFQVTVHAQTSGEPHYVRTLEGLKKIDSFYVHFYGVKVESPSQTIKVEQSQSDRSKKPFHPVHVDLSNDQVVKLTVGRLHFSETTSNNMRKKGKPNPDQRYFYLVVGLHAHSGDMSYPLMSSASERIIVRASNPGQFESEVELSWQKGQTAESIYHAGRVGVNTDRPDESLVVHGNIKLTGHIVQPSDLRAKKDIEEVDTKEQLRNLQQLRIVRYQYKDEFAEHAGMAEHERSDTGVIAQEVQKVIPDAVKATGDIVLPSGQRINNFLVVNKDRIFIENIGAVKELCKVTDNLENRIDELERMNTKLAKLKRIDSMKSTSSGSTVTSSVALSRLPSTKKAIRRRPPRIDNKGLCSSKFVQGTIIVLILVMAMCLIAMATLYILEWQKRQVYDFPTSTSSPNGVTNRPSNMTASPGNSSLTQSRQFQNGSGSTTPSVILKMPTVIHATSSSFSVSVHGNKVPIGVPVQCIGAKARLNNCRSFCCNSQSASASSVPSEPPTPLPTNARPLPSLATTTSTTQPSRRLSPPLRTTEIRTISVTPSSIIGMGSVSGTEMGGVFGGGAGVVHSSRSSSSAGAKEEVEYSTPDNSEVDKNAIKPEEAMSEDNNAWDDGFVNRALKPSYRYKTSNHDKPSRQERQMLFEEQRNKRESPKLDHSSSSSREDSNLSSIVHSLRLVEFNQLISPEYCTSCQDGNYTYHIPISRYMTQQTLTLEFNLSVSAGVFVDYCQTGNKITECSHLYNQESSDTLVPSALTNERKTQEQFPSWNLPIGKFVESSYKFRVTTIENHVNACTARKELANVTFMEYNLVFYRTCTE